MSNKLYIIAIGGSGAKCVESIVQIAATGLYTKEEIEVLFVDPDENNGNVDRARKTLSTYQECQKLVTGGSTEQQIEWMSTPIKSYDLWSPFQGKLGGRELASYFNYGTMDAGLANLLEVLYTPEERNQQLDEGFRGRPAIGAAVMSQIDLKRLEIEPWGSFIQSINNAVGAQGKQARVLLCGSIFGGTGASGIPTIARLLRNKLEQQNIADRVKLGGLFLLPYFSFTVPPGAETNGLYAASDQFLLNTESALRYYVTQASQLFDTVYLLGNENTSEVEFSVGNTTQTNRPHFVELYAALAVRDFLIEDRDDALMSITRDRVGEIKWSDLPDDFNVKKLMTNAARLAYLWTSDIEKTAKYTLDNGFKIACRDEPWLDKYYDPQADSQDRFDLPHQQKGIETLSNWSRSYLFWLKELHVDKIDRLQLFNTQIFGDLNGNIQFHKLEELLLREAAIAQWQGMLAAIALSKVRGFQLKAELIDLNKLKDNYPFAAALYELLPNSGKTLHQLTNKHPWEELYVWSWKKQAVGITSPTTIIAPAAEANWDGLPWWNPEFKRLEAPHRHLNPDERPLLREWLNNLWTEVNNSGYQGDKYAIETIANLLKEYTKTLTGETDRSDILDLDSPNHFGVAINRGVFNGLNYPIKGKTISLVESPVRVIPSDNKSDKKPLLLIDTYLAEHWGVPKQNICIYADKTLESLNIDDLRSGKMTDWDNNINWIEPSQILLPDLHFMDVENALPGAFAPTTSQPLLFNKQKITPLLPINRILLDYFTPEDLMRRLKFEPGDSNNTVRVKLNLPLVGMNPTSSRPSEYQIVREYILDERYLIKEIPVLEIYPHFKIAGGGWHEYYAFYHDPSRDNSAFQVAFDDARDPHVFEDGGKYLTTRLEEFPTHINCLYKGQNIGAIVLPTPESITLTDTWKVGVDFGTSFTNIYVNRHGKNESLQLDSLHLKITDADEETRNPALFEYFIPESFVPLNKPLPLSTILTQRGQTRNDKKRPIYDGRIYIPDTGSGFRPDSKWMKTDIKWKDKDLSQLFLQHLALIISALAAKDGANQIKWSISYPSAFSKGETRKYVKTWEDLIGDLGKQMSIEHIAPKQGETSFRTESLAIAQYFADKEDCNLIGSACIDLGGGTSDISIWQDNRLIHQCSIQLAGRHLLSQFLELRPELISKWFGQESVGWKDLNDEQFKSKIDVLLRHHSEAWLKDRRHTLEEDKDFQGLLRLMTVGIAGIYYYIGTILHTLQREEKYTESEIPAIYIGGNGSRLLHWIATGGEFNKHTDLNELFNRMLAAPSGLEEVDNPTQLSQRPKDEVVCGLVSDRTRLTGLDRKDKDPIIAGETCLINSREIAWTSRLELDDDENISEFTIPQLDRLKQFVEDFNRGLKDLDIEEIKPFNTYQRKTGLDAQYSIKLWGDTHKEMRKMLLDIKGKSDDIRIEPPFIIGLKALLRALAKEWAGK